MKLVVILEKSKSDFREICKRCYIASVPITVNFSEVKVKVQGQNNRTENFHLSVIARPGFQDIFIKFVNLIMTLGNLQVGGGLNPLGAF